MSAPTNCWYCGAMLKAGKTHLFVKLPGVVKRQILVEDVPAFVCMRCEETYVDPAIQTMVRERAMGGGWSIETIVVGLIHFNKH